MCCVDRLNRHVGSGHFIDSLGPDCLPDGGANIALSKSAMIPFVTAVQNKKDLSPERLLGARSIPDLSLEQPFANETRQANNGHYRTTD